MHNLLLSVSSTNFITTQRILQQLLYNKNIGCEVPHVWDQIMLLCLWQARTAGYAIQSTLSAMILAMTESIVYYTIQLSTFIGVQL